MANANLQELYRSYLAQGLLGQDTLQGQGAQAAQFQAGLQTINAQTQQARQNLLNSLSSRGLLRSGMTSTGLGEIESGRAQSLASLSADLERQRQQQLLQTQQNAASLLSGDVRQQRQIAANEPTFGETLGSLAGAYAQYQAINNAQQPNTNILSRDVLNTLGVPAIGAPPAAPLANVAGRPAGSTSSDVGFTVEEMRRALAGF